MSAIIEKITDFIRNILEGWILSNLHGMFSEVNTQVGNIAGTVAITPSDWEPSIFRMVRTISDNVIVPIAGVVIAYVLIYELISMVVDKNNANDYDVGLFVKYLMKACIAVLLLSKTADITMAFFDLGGEVVTRVGGLIPESTSLDVERTLDTLFEERLAYMDLGQLFGLGLETMIVGLTIKIISALIMVVVFSRMIEIYIYISISPIPFATLTNRDWGNVGTNYIRGLMALAFQGFFIMICVAIYAALIGHLVIADDLHTSLWEIVGYTIALCFSLFKTSSVSKSIFGAH